MKVESRPQEKSGAQETQIAEEPSTGRRRFLETSSLLLILALILIAYSPVLFNFFNGDDFVHLTWLREAIHRPDLVLRNFYTSWLDGTTTKFYRPLISVFMVSDYAVYGVNGLGFRITNIIFHYVSTLFIYLIARHLQDKSNGSIQEKRPQEKLFWPLAASALFALHPLHPEAVSWITGRVDSVVTAFCLAASYFYMSGSSSGKRWRFILALFSTSLALLSKEMAITLPAVFVLYELVYLQDGKAIVSAGPAHKDKPSGTPGEGSATPARGNLALESLKKQLLPKLQACSKTIPFFLLLAVYFAVRRIALGTFVGGYDNSLFFISDLKGFVNGWIHAVLLLLVPINKSLISSHHILSKLFPAALICAIVCAAANFVFEAKQRKHFLFLAGWVLLSLVPVYKLFNIADDLQGSRLAYLATVPLSLLLTCGMLGSERLNKLSFFRYGRFIANASLIVLSAILLWINNQPWKAAGEENNAIRKSLQELYDQISGDPQMLLLGLPDQISGAYTCRNSLDGMTKKPQLSRDITNVLMVNAFEPIFPFAYLKDSIVQNKDSILIYRWDSTARKFIKVDLSAVAGPESKTLEEVELSRISRLPEECTTTELSRDVDGSVVVKNKGTKPQFLEFDLGKHSCYKTEFIELKLKLDKSDASMTSRGIDLLYSNDLNPGFELKRRAHAHFKDGSKEQKVIFALRGLPEWSLGGNCGKFRLLIPRDTTYQLVSIKLREADEVLPTISFKNSGYLGSKGYLHLDRKQQEEIIEIDASKLEGAKKLALEVTRTNLLFEEQNPQVKSNVSQPWRILAGTRLRHPLNYSDFGQVGLYELRVFALDDQGEIRGVASDHIVISVN